MEECNDMKTLNAAAAKYNSISLIVRILCGLVIGAVLALTVPGAGWVAELGTPRRFSRGGSPVYGLFQSR